MPTTKREMSGVANLSGRTVGSLRIGEMIARYPTPRYKTVCTTCGAQSFAVQTTITSGVARCLSAGCGREAIRETTAETPGKVRRREESEAATKRRAAEEAEAAALVQAEAELTATATKVAQTIRERIATQQDDECFVSSELANARMSMEEAVKFDGEQFNIFAGRSAWFCSTPANRKAVLDYFARNRLEIFDAAMWEKAARRLADFGLLPDEKPAPEPAKPQSKPIEVNLTKERPSEPPQARQNTFKGFDPMTGAEREYTRREVDLMSADEYRRVFRVYRDALTLPNRAAF